MASPPRDRSRRGALGEGLMLLGLTVVGGVMRISTIATRGLWLDEASTVNQTRGTLLSTILSQVGNTHPPLFHILMHVWTSAFGTGEVAIRMFAAVFGIAAIPAAFWLGRTLYDRKVGLIAAALLAVWPYHIWYSQEARMYSMLMFFGLLSIGCLYRALRDGGRRWWAAYLATILAGSFTHYFFLLLLGGEVLYFVAVEVIGRKRLEPAGRRTASRPVRRLFAEVPALKPWLIVNAILAVAVLAWMRFALLGAPVETHGVLTSLTRTGLGYGAPPPSFAFRFNDILATFAEALFGTHSSVVMSALVAAWPLLIYAMLLLLGLARHVDRRSALLLCSTAGAFVLWTLGQWQGVVLLSRYLMPMAAAGLILAAVAIARLRPRPAAIVLAACLLVGVVAWAAQSFDENALLRYGDREAVAYVVKNHQPGDTIIYEPFYTNVLVDYYLPKSFTAYSFPELGRDGRFRDSKDLLAQDLETVVGITPRVWVVLGFQNVPHIGHLKYMTDQWFLRNGYRIAESVEFNKVEVRSYEYAGIPDTAIPLSESQ